MKGNISKADQNKGPKFHNIYRMKGIPEELRIYFANSCFLSHW